MRKISMGAVILLAACSPKQSTEEKTAEKQESTNWPELEAFHMMMAESFHPYQDSSNLEPAKTNALELSRLAEKWVTAPLPEKVNNDDVKQKLEKLKEEAVTFTTLIDAGDEKQLGESLNRMHSAFHEIQDAWYKEE